MNITEYLTSLGSTSEEVAESLHKQGIKGKRSSTCACPILNAIAAVLPQYKNRLHIYGSWRSDGNHHYYTSLDNGYSLDNSHSSSNDLSKAVADFIAAFDAGRYPGLEE